MSQFSEVRGWVGAVLVCMYVQTVRWRRGWCCRLWRRYGRNMLTTGKGVIISFSHRGLTVKMILYYYNSPIFIIISAQLKCWNIKLFTDNRKNVFFSFIFAKYYAILHWRCPISIYFWNSWKMYWKIDFDQIYVWENKVQLIGWICFFPQKIIIHNTYIYTYYIPKIHLTFFSYWYNFVYLVWRVFLWKLINEFAKSYIFKYKSFSKLFYSLWTIKIQLKFLKQNVGL